MAELKLKELREQENLTQKELTKQLKMKPMTYNNYEKRKTEPNIDTLILIADYYGVTLDYICNHKAPFQTEIGYLDNNQKQLLLLIKQLNKTNCIKAYGYVSGLIAGQE